MAKQKYYKAFEEDLTCRNFHYEIGKTYTMKSKPKICSRGYHFCKTIADVYRFYPTDEHTRVCEVEPLGTIVTDEEGMKFATNKIRIVKEIKNPRIKTNTSNSKGFCNSGYNNNGDWNSGIRNYGNRNSGDCNNGCDNTGHHNDGSFNTGSRNKGGNNAGSENSGWDNTGNGNIGYNNTGENNQGHCNSGYCNRGNYNSGNFNTGNRNSGYWNLGNNHTGVFNTTSDAKIYMFNKASDWTIEDWKRSDANWVLHFMPVNKCEFVYTDEMTEEEKAKHPEYSTIGGYLKEVYVNDDDRQKWWNELNEYSKNAVRSLPNFDATIFYECTGIKVGE